MTEPYVLVAALALAGLVLAAAAVPLMRDRVPRNGLYGVRLPKTLRSDEDWYAGNRYGGKALGLAGLVIFAASLLLLPLAPVLGTDALGYVGLTVIVVALVVALVATLRYVARL